MSDREPATDSRRRQIIVGALIIGAVGLLAVLLWLGRAIPGLFGEWFGVVAGIASTPFLMEATFVVLGLMIVLGLNAWRHHREGDECVYLEQVGGPGSENLPESARWAIYRDEPEPAEAPDDLVLIEGAIAIGDFDQASRRLADLDPERLDETDVLRLRLRLAEESGEHERARALRERLSGH